MEVIMKIRDLYEAAYEIGMQMDPRGASAAK